jgi:chemotaxis protein methyltransferase CheR
MEMEAMKKPDPAVSEFYKAELSNKEFDQLSQFIMMEYGIKLPPVKKVMLQSRLQKRLRTLQMTSFKEYIEYVFSKDGQENEVVHMIDVVSTNKTDFFREPVHFEFLLSDGLNALVQPNTRKNLKLWSAGCSSGEEPYTIAITMEEFRQNNSLVDYTILGTDISSRILQSAVDAIYKEERISIVPQTLKQKYFLKSKDRTNPKVRLIPEIRKKTQFARLNFMDMHYGVKEMYDIIFCRNVLIYFDRVNQEKIINRLCNSLISGGYFFMGHSESITNLSVPLQQIKPTIFKRI